MGGAESRLEGRAGCGCGDVVRAGQERASLELCWEPGEERWDGVHLCEEA